MIAIPYSRQNINQNDIESVTRVLQSDFLTQGLVVPEFERKIANYCGVQYGVAANSATSSLHLACLALGVGPGDRVWTSAITFVASANCALYCGASIDFVDIDPDSYNISVDALEDKLCQAEKVGQLPKVVIPVHMCGQPCEMDRIRSLSRRFGFLVIEDASHAIGARYRGSPVGDCKYSDICVFSFHPVKNITTGEGGIALTNDSLLARKMERLRSHGITRDPADMVDSSDGFWAYQQIELGFNYRMTEMQAALGISQLSRLDQFVAERRRQAIVYDRLLSNDLISIPLRHPEGYSSFHLYVVQLKLESLRVTQKDVFSRLRSQGIMVNLHYVPVYKHPFYRSTGHAKTSLPNAERYYARAISLPLYPGLTRDQQDEIAEKIMNSIDHHNAL